MQEGKHSITQYVSIVSKNWTYLYIGVYVFIYNTLPKNYYKVLFSISVHLEEYSEKNNKKVSTVKKNKN